MKRIKTWQGSEKSIVVGESNRRIGFQFVFF